jgi:hypothetical protein
MPKMMTLKTVQKTADAALQIEGDKPAGKARAKDPFQVPKRFGHAGVLHEGALWVFNGQGESEILPDLWRAGDLDFWQAPIEHTPFTPRSVADWDAPARWH